MPTSVAPDQPAPPLPMLRPAGHADAWHNVAAPGGYEWWYFDAESDDGRTHVVAIFLEGFVFHPGYLRAYARYRRRPTRVPPPRAGNYPCAYLTVYRDGRVAAQFMTQFAPAAFAADPAGPAVTIGPNTMALGADGAYRLTLTGTPWVLTARGPQLLAARTLAAELAFRPTLDTRPAERRFFSRAMSGADHHWVLAAPRCEVTGTLDLGTGEPLAFAGRGYHDHNFGTGPIGPGLKRWIWGRVLTDDGVVSFHFARPSDPRLPDEVHLLRADAGGVAEVACAARVDWSRRTGWLLAYPASADFGPELRLANPRVVDSAPFYMRLTYEAETPGRRGTAFCEVAYPHRLRHPVLGRMIEMSIDKRAARPAPART